MNLEAVKIVDSIPLQASVGPYGITAFGEQRVATPYTLADLISKYGRNPIDLESAVVGAGTIVDVPTASGFRLAVSAAANDAALVRSSTYYRYQSGRGLKITQTGVLETLPTGGTVARWGFFDGNDGIFWQYDTQGFAVVVRSSTSGAPVDTIVRQANWNVPAPPVDNGVFSVQRGNIYEIQLQWLGVGDVQFFINGNLVHTIHNANGLQVPYMRTADLPISWQIVNGAAPSPAGASFLAVCGNVTVQGGENPPEYGFGVERDAFGAVAATYTPLLAIRLASTINGVDNREVVYPTRVIVSCETNRVAYRVLLNPATLTGAAFSAVGGGSGVEFDIAATAFTGGTYLTGGFLPNAQDALESALTDIFKVNARKLRRSSITGTSDVLLVVGRNEAGGAATMRAGLHWVEVR